MSKNVSGIINKHRPKDLSQVIGQNSVVKSIEKLIESDIPHAFLFEGNSGTGKTTISRILGDILKAEIIEIDGATHTGVDDMREIANNLKYASFTNPTKLLILDECHYLSGNAWSSWLKLVEEPPQHLYFCFCTTESKKIPKAIRTRCHGYTLKDIDEDTLFTFIEDICKKENTPLQVKIIDLIARESGGSARQALVYYSEVAHCSSFDEAVDVLKSAYQKTEVIDFCRMLMKIEYRNTIMEQKAISILKELKGVNPESIRIQVAKYFDACVLNARTEVSRLHSLRVLEAFSGSFNHPTGFSDIILATFKLFYEKS